LKQQNEIVPIQLAPTGPNLQAKKKSTVAAELTVGETKVTIHNGIDKYILYTLLKEIPKDVD
jgi:hypothetical protein